MKHKQKYLAPSIEVIKMENEGVIATSGNLPGVGDGGSATGVAIEVPITEQAAVIWKT